MAAVARDRIVPVQVELPAPAISVRGLRKSYGSVEAVRGIDFQIRPGEIFALLGPNGAGKTTTVEILEGYRSRDAGASTQRRIERALFVQVPSSSSGMHFDTTESAV